MWLYIDNRGVIYGIEWLTDRRDNSNGIKRLTD